MSGLFFTGTDTGVGKTHVVCGVARVLAARGVRAAVSKPVATGAGPHRYSEDTIRLAESVGRSDPDSLRLITPWTFPDPVAPAVAARRSGRALVLAEVAAAVRRLEQPGQVVLAEGVGGLLCPLAGRETIADLTVLLGFPVVVVARRSLGTLNHTLLTVGAALARGLRVAGVVVSETVPPEGLADETNVAELRGLLDVPVLAVVPHRPGADEAAGALAGVDWAGLAGRPGPA